MPRETEHKIEGLLRAWAKQRREEVEDDFEIHPASRRLLLEQVARTYPKTTHGRFPWGQLFGVLRQRAAGLAGFAVIAVIVLWGLKTFWVSFTNFDILRVQEENPPEHYKFTLRKPVEEDRLSMKGRRDSNRAPQLLAKADLPAKSKSPELTAAEKLKEALPPAPPTAPTPMRDPFTLATGFRREPKSGAFNPFTAAASATGSVATLTASLATKASNSTTQDKRMETKLTEARTEVAAIAPKTPPPPAAAAPEPSLKDRLVAPPALRAVEPTKNAPVVVDSVAANADAVVAGKPTTASGALAAGELAFAKPSAAPRAKTTVPTEPPAPVVGLFFVRADDSSAAAPPATRGDAGSVGRIERKSEAAAILSEFELKRDGSKVTLIDADGSVYEGAVMAREAGATAPARTALGGAARARRGGPDSLANTADQPNTFAFRVSGSSRSLQQTVVITATVANSDDESPAPSLGARESAQAVAKSAPEAPRSQLAVAPPAATTTTTSAFRFSLAASVPALRTFDGSKVAPPVQHLEGTIRVGASAEQPIKAVRSR